MAGEVEEQERKRRAPLRSGVGKLCDMGRQNFHKGEGGGGPSTSRMHMLRGPFTHKKKPTQGNEREQKCVLQGKRGWRWGWGVGGGRRMQVAME